MEEAMALLAGVKDFFGLNERRAVCNELNLLGAAEAHILWKARLGHHIEGNIREPLEHVLVGQSGFCQLGCWINGPELEPFRDMPEFEQLKEAHRQFHQFGGLIVDRLKVGERSAAREIFRNEYNQALRAIIQALTGINRQIQEG
jgi:methyl-accepting chemotaxis protein